MSSHLNSKSSILTRSGICCLQSAIYDLLAQAHGFSTIHSLNLVSQMVMQLVCVKLLQISLNAQWLNRHLYSQRTLPLNRRFPDILPAKTFPHQKVRLNKKHIWSFHLKWAKNNHLLTWRRRRHPPLHKCRSSQFLSQEGPLRSFEWWTLNCLLLIRILWWKCLR